VSEVLVIDTIQLTVILASGFLPAGILIGYVNSKVKILQSRVKHLEDLTELLDYSQTKTLEAFKNQGVRQ
jgi:uncharacterized protein YxeA